MAKRSNKTLVLSLIAEADEVAKEHVNYHEQYVVSANEVLYKLLASMLQVCLDVEASGETARVVKEMRSKLKSDYGIKTQANSRASSIVVRYIVRSSRRTAHVYGRVIEVAIANNITAEQLPDFIRDRGGIEEIRLSVVSAEEKKAESDRWANARDALTGLLYKREPIGKVVLNNNVRLPYASDVAFSYLICNKNLSTGEIDVLGAVYPSSDIETRALNLFALNSIAMKHNRTNKFYELCKQFGFDQDMLIDWMKANGFETEELAKNFTRTLISQANELNTKGE
jgi:hypothetical protein